MSSTGLNADELLLVYLTLLARDEENSGHAEFFRQWYDSGGKDRLRSLFLSLKEKGVILKSYSPDTYNPNEIEFNKLFLNRWFKASAEMGKELFDLYPSWVNVKGTYYPLKDISKRFSSLEEAFFFYGVQIGHNPEKHKEVMEILQWAIDNGHINFGILNFIISNQWNTLKELRDNPEIAPISQNSILDE